MLVNIKLLDPSRASQALKELFTIINNDKELQQQITASGILLEGLQSDELAQCRKILQDMNYSAFRAPSGFLQLFAEDNKLNRLFNTLGKLLVPEEMRQQKRALLRLLSTRGITLMGLTTDKAHLLKKLLQSKWLIVTVIDPSHAEEKPGKPDDEKPKPIDGPNDPPQDDTPDGNNNQPPDTPYFPEPGDGKNEFMVSGTVYLDDGRPLPGVLVRAYDKDMRSEEILGEILTDKQGNYQIVYYEHQFSRAEKGTADLIIRVYSPQALLAESPDILFNAPPHAVIDIYVPADYQKAPSEWERYHAIIKPLRQEVEVADLTDDDLEFLSREAEISSGHLHSLRLDAQWARQYKMIPAVFYGLLRQGLPPIIHLLLATKPSRKREALKASLAENLIPESIGDDFDAVMDQLKNTALQVSFEHDGTSAFGIGALLEGSAIDTGIRYQVAEFILTWEGDGNIWEALLDQEGIDQQVIDEVRFVTQANSLLSGHLPTIQLIQKYKLENSFVALSDFASLTPQNWRDLISNLPSGDLPEGYENFDDYADALSGSVEVAFPTAVLTHRLANDQEFGSHDLNYFLQSNPTFDFLYTPVDAFFQQGAETGQINDPDALRNDLKVLQRVAQLTPGRGRFEVMKGLLHSGYDSAFKIATSNPEEVYNNIVQISGPTIATEVLRNASRRYQEAQLLHLGLRDFWIDRPWVIPGIDFSPSEPSSELPEWATLFGSAGFCQCEHCRSVNSPAAYLADLLQYLKRAPQALSGQYLHEIFRQRRPEIEHILLNCDNAHTPIPYIDLVNETLERFVTGSTSGPWHQTTGNTALEKARLRAFPAQEDPHAWEIIAGERFPWVLPVNLDWIKAHYWADHHKLNLHQVRSWFGADVQNQAMLMLGLDPQNWQLITQPAENENELALNWGLSSLSDWQSEIPAVLQRTGLSYQELEALLTANFFQEYDLGIDISADPCDYLQHLLERPSDDVLDRIHRFLRLRLRLGWTIQKLDSVLSHLEISETDGDALISLARLLQIAEQTSSDPVRLAEIVSRDEDGLLEGLAAILGLTLRELRTFYHLTGTDLVDPANRLTRIYDFLQSVEIWRSTGADIYELRWILRHDDLSPAIYGSREESLINYLDTLHQAVAELRNDRLAASETRIDRMVQETLASLPPGTSPEDSEAALEAAREAELEAIEAELQMEVEELILEHLAGYLGTEVTIMDTLLRPGRDDEGDITYPSVLVSVTDPIEPAMLDWLLFVNTDEPGDTIISQTLELLIRLDKVVRVVRITGLQAHEISVAGTIHAGAGFPDFNQFAAGPTDEPSWESWENLARAVLLQRRLPQADITLFDLMAMALSGDFSTEMMLEELADATGWETNPHTGESSPVLHAMFDALFPGADATVLGQAENFEKLHTTVQWLQRWRVQPEILINLGTAEISEISPVLMEISRGQFSGDLEWYTAVNPLMDRLREHKRDALLAWILNSPLTGPDDEPLWDDANDLYGYLFLDVQMNACQLTSRIVQATNAIQHFVQRTLMGLEPNAIQGENTDAAHWKQWEWMKNYRVWEANRKVFLFPENWIEPDLRTDASPFFKDLTQELLQGEINQENVQKAYSNYFSKLDEVSRLDIRGIYEERIPGASGVVTHVFGRTRGNPSSYFYRKRNADRTWSSWQPIEAGITGNHLLPAVIHGRLLMFWAKFTEVQAGITPAGDPIKEWEVHLAWSEYKNNIWQAPKETTESIRLALHPQSDYSFRLLEQEEEFFLAVYRQQLPYRHGQIFNLSLGQGDVFKLDFCDGDVIVQAAQRLAPLIHPNRTDIKSMKLIENAKQQDFLSVTPFWLRNQDLVIDPEVLAELRERLRNNPGTGAGQEIIRRVLEILNLIYETTELNHILLNRTPGQFKITPTHQYEQFKAFQPFVLDMDKRTWFVSHQYHEEIIFIPIPGSSGFGGTIPGFSSGYFDFPGQTTAEMFRFEIRIRNWYKFENFYHPFYCDMVERFNREGLDGLLKAPARQFRLHRQLFKEGQRYSESGQQLFGIHPPRFNEYEPTGWVWRNLEDTHSPYPYEQYDFSFTGAYSVYNWELFFHTPLLVADRLSKNQRFAEAQKWFHYIFDPTDFSAFETPAKYWQIKPLFELANSWSGPAETLQQLMLRLNAGSAELEEQVDAWRNDPFNPHLIARMRLAAYMKTVVQKYLDNLIDWGDHLFAQETMESVNEAAQIYVLAAQILGKRPVQVNRPQTSPRSYAQLEEQFDAFSNALVEIESYLAPALSPSSDDESGEVPLNMMLYFCLPSNEKLLAYWDTLEDRLFKLRNCMNLEGQIRQIPLFAPPIDPALLVRARAMGLDLSDAISSTLNPGLPHYRYRFLADKAMAFCNDVRSLGSQLLSTLEKKDNANLTMLRARMETALLDQAGRMYDMKIEEAENVLQALQVSLEVAEHNYDYYNNKDFINVAEGAEMVSLGFSLVSGAVGKGFNTFSSFSHLIPEATVSVPPANTFGGSNLGNSLKGMANIFESISKGYEFASKMSGLVGKHQQRMDGWRQQAKLAAFDIKRIEKQMVAAEIKLDMTLREKALQERRLRDAREVETFHSRKFTGAQLYGWMSGQVSALYYQAYRMAVDLARKAETAAQFELAVNPADFRFIDYGHWDNQQKGLLAGDRLQQNLRRLDTAYLDKNKREYELTKRISLPDLDPMAFIALRETGHCDVTLPEVLFDLDHPGHFMRRIKTVNLTITSGAGANTSVGCKLTLLNSTTRINNSRPEQYPQNLEEDDNRFVTWYGAIQSIATSFAQKDSGLFELNFRDERYLPFEGSGAISTWRLELSGKWGDVELPQFDFESISEVLLEVKYTARDGGERLKNAAVNNLQNALNELTRISDQNGLLRMISLSHEFFIEWSNFVASPSHTLHGISITREHFPILARSRQITVNAAHVFLSGREAPLAPHNFEFSGNENAGWTVNINLPDDINPEEVDDVFVVLQYTIG
ncbi:MAG: hypothetical protein EA361_18945 [Bacteroidetes bacterium]|nr:MAG: hypothetical protein EA361_18945 [Bacteroidota bacterium]